MGGCQSGKHFKSEDEEDEFDAPGCVGSLSLVRTGLCGVLRPFAFRPVFGRAPSGDAWDAAFRELTSVEWLDVDGEITVAVDETGSCFGLQGKMKGVRRHLLKGGWFAKASAVLEKYGPSGKLKVVAEGVDEQQVLYLYIYSNAALAAAASPHGA